MDYEKKYKNALEWARQVMNGETGFIRKEVEKVFSELKESEDEKIRKEIIALIEWSKSYAASGITTDEANEMLAWLEKQDNLMKALQISNSRIEELVEEKYNLEEKLEKQGEQKPYGQRQECADCQFNYAGECKGSCTMKRGEQKPAFEIKTPEESLGIDSDTYNKIVDECVYGEQKPAWSEESEENFKHLMDEIVCLGNSRNSANRLYYDRLIKFIKELKNRAQPKEKWCNKDERMLDRLIAYFEKQVAFTDDDNPRYANWLKSLKDRVLSQPKQEWSEEDENMRYKATAVINRLCAEGKDYVWSIKTLKKLFYWLKSLRPQPKQEVDEQIETIAMHLDNCGDTAMAEILRSCNLRPQNTWKPSEKQMITLRQIISGCSYDIEPLAEIEEQLKKLREE